MKKCADFQVEGGNCALMLPTESLWKSDLYNKYVKFTTVRRDLPLFAFDGYTEPLRTHITILYFVQPELLSQLIDIKTPRIYDEIVIPQEDKTEIRIIHQAAPRQQETNTMSFSPAEEKDILDLFDTGKSVTYIKEQKFCRYGDIRAVLNKHLGEAKVDKYLHGPNFDK